MDTHPIPYDLLEAYALDQLAPAERARVARALDADPTLQAELTAIEEALQALAEAEAVTPPPALRARVLDAVADAIAEDQRTTPPQFGERADVRRLSVPQVFAVAASVVVLAILGVTAWRLDQRLDATQAELAALRDQTAATDSLVRRSQLATQNLSLEIALTQQGFRQVRLDPVKDSLQASAIVYWNGAQGEVYFLGRLPAPPPGKQYQLWALKDGQTIDLGLLGVKPNGVLEPMKSIQGADAFAVTLEPLGGKPQPTLSALTVMGAVKPA